MDNELIEELMSVSNMDRDAAEQWADEHCKGWRTEPRAKATRILTEKEEANG